MGDTERVSARSAASIMTGSNGSDEERSQNQSDRASRFSDIASEFSDEFGERSVDSAESHRESESPEAEDDASDRVKDPNDDADSWEWVGDDQTADTADQNPSDLGASDTSEQPTNGSRVWNDGSVDTTSTDDGSVDTTSTDDGSVDTTSTDDGSVDTTSTDDGPADDESIEDDPVKAVPTDGDQTRDDTGRTGSHAGGVDTDPNSDNQADGTGGRIWDESSNTSNYTTSTETVRSPSDETVSATSPPTGATGEIDPSSLFDEGQLGPGTNVLIQSESRSEQTQASCHQLLFEGDSDLDPYVLLLRYQPIEGERLEDIASKGHRTHVISIGYAQSVPPAADELVEVTQINNPNDITRLGIVVSRVTQGWSTDDRDIRVCYDSLNILLNYRDVKNAFRFLHVFLSTFTKTDAVAHFHADPLEGDPQAINTLKPLFDEVVSIDSTGTYVE
ncbi:MULTISPECIES: hypothetical protein [Halorubrum]|nr:MULTISPECIES: hypothetical protein [Halorubrum]TKX71198.1 hypothetical protein EXE40_08165 [Halorubrum sp. GN11GM_10-3_MGM]